VTPNAKQPMVLVGSGSQIWREYLLPAMAEKYSLHLLTPKEPTWEVPYIAGFDLVDTMDAKAMEEAARARFEEVAGILTYEETRVESAARLATAFGVRTSPPEAVYACRDKYASREAMRRAGLPGAQSIAVATLEEAESAARIIGYPLIVKPRALSASCGVSLVTEPGGLPAAVEEAARIWFDVVPTYEQPTLVEEYLEGPEISVEAVCRDGQVTALFVARKSLGFPPGFEEVGHLVRSDDPLLRDPDLLGLLQAAHRAVGLTDTITHTEIRLTQAGPRVVEINARVGGGRIPYLGQLATGVDVGLAAADLAAGAEPALEPVRTGVAAIRFLYPERDLRVEAIDVDRGKLPPEAHEVQVLAKPGDELLLPPTDHVRSRYAFVVVTAPDEKTCTAALDEAAAALTVRGTPLS